MSNSKSARNKLKIRKPQERKKLSKEKGDIKKNQTENLYEKHNK